MTHRLSVLLIGAALAGTSLGAQTAHGPLGLAYQFSHSVNDSPSF